MFIIDDILLFPLNGTIWIAEKIQEVINRELLDEDRVKEKLTELQGKFEMEEISEQEYMKQQEMLMERLELIRKFKANN